MRDVVSCSHTVPSILEWTVADSMLGIYSNDIDYIYIVIGDHQSIESIKEKERERERERESVTIKCVLIVKCICVCVFMYVLILTISSWFPHVNIVDDIRNANVNEVTPIDRLCVCVCNTYTIGALVPILN